MMFQREGFGKMKKTLNGNGNSEKSVISYTRKPPYPAATILT